MFFLSFFLRVGSLVELNRIRMILKMMSSFVVLSVGSMVKWFF